MNDLVTSLLNFNTFEEICIVSDRFIT
jgi:hypothetical protein